MELEPVFGRVRRVLAAVSGGSDSVALLLLLNDLRLKGEIEVCAAHLNHGIRGAQADGDEAFVVGLCDEIGVELYREKIDVPALARQSGLGLETAARNARWEFLLRAKKRLNCEAIATAHHMDDQAETVLMHLFRGGGLRGASGMSPEYNGVIRPLLNAKKAELTEFLRARNQPFREDATNACNDNPRNFLRNEVLPLVKTVYPGYAKAIGRFADIARVEDGYMRRVCFDWMEQNAFITPFGYAMRFDADVAILRRAAAELTKSGYESVVSAVSGIAKGRPVEIPGWRVEYAGEMMYFISEDAKPARESVILSDGARISGIGRLSVSPVSEAKPSCDPYDQILDFDKLAGAVLRTRLPGDRMRPLGFSGTKKLKDIFIDVRVARPMRDYTPVVARGSEILWIPGECISHFVKLTGATVNPARLKWEREDMIPWKRSC